MKYAWTISTYVRSQMPLTDKVAPAMQFTSVVFGLEKPKAETIEALVASHTRNVDILFSEVEFTPLPDELFDNL